jgi:aspartate ammonia-lyase
MKKYHLSFKDGEIINKTAAEDIQSAISIFSQRKNLFPEQLLEIYDVIESKEGDTGGT